MNSSPQKRKNPFGNLVNVLKQKSRYDTNVDALYDQTVSMLMNAQIDRSATNGLSTRCYRCNRMASLQPCHFCEHAICSNCRQSCSTCNNEFCGTCSTINYSSHIERTFCLSCSSQ